MRLERILFSFALVVLISVPAFASFVDVPKENQAAPAVQKLLETGIIRLAPDRKFNGKSPVTLYQLAMILDQIIDKSGKKAAVEAMPLGDFFTNIPKSHYAYQAVRDLVKLKVFSVPQSRKFSGNLKLSRIEFYAYLAAFLEKLEGKGLPAAPPESVYADLTKEHPDYLYIQKLVGAGLLSGEGKFRENMIINRYEMAIFINRIIDYYLQLEAKEKAELSSGYIDIPEDNYAREAIDELIAAGILGLGEGRRFYGDTAVTRYYLVDLIAKAIEEVILQEEVSLAPFARSYKDVPVSYYAYPSIQKLISLGVIPPGNRLELFYGDRKINRYQMVYFSFSAIEYMLQDIIAFPAAHSSLGYGDVPVDYFVFDTIQKLIWLDVLEGGLDKRFGGEDYVDRYEFCSFLLDLIEAVFVKIEELEELAYEKPAGVGIDFYLNSQFNVSQLSNNPSPGQELTDVSAYQLVELSVNRSINRNISAYASLSSSYNFGDTASAATPFLNQAYLLMENSPLVLQIGRTSYYQGYTPFGNSLYVDTSSDLVFLNYDHHLFSLNSAIGKLAYLQDVSADSNFGTLGITSKLPPLFNWLELSLGASLITDLPDPSFTYLLPTRVEQNYAGLKINLLSVFEFTAETANLNFSDPSVIPLISTGTKEDTTASQYSISYISEDFGYSFSLGYQVLGDAYYLSTFADPTIFVGSAQGAESILFRTRYYPSAEQMIGADLSYALEDGFNTKTGITGYYNFEIFENSYLNFNVSRVLDNTSAAEDEFRGSASFSLSL